LRLNIGSAPSLVPFAGELGVQKEKEGSAGVEETCPLVVCTEMGPERRCNAENPIFRLARSSSTFQGTGLEQRAAF